MTPITHSGERGTVSELQMVRLADEGVPIRALVRVFRRPFDEVERLLKDAKSDGRIIDLPASDWPPTSRRESRMPTVVPASGGVTDDFVHAIRSVFGLTDSEARLFGLLIWRGRVSKASLHEFVTNEAEPKIIDVFVCKIRRKLSPFQIGIETVWGWGYSVTEEVRGQVVARLRAAPLTHAPISDLMPDQAVA